MPNTRQIFIVDDDPELRDVLSEQLSLYEEFKAFAAENGTKGVQAAKAGQIDLVIMDVGLPDIDGREAVRIFGAGTASRRRSSCSRAMAPISTPSSASIRAPTTTSPSRFASQFCWRTFGPSCASTKGAKMLFLRSGPTFRPAQCCCSPRAARSA